MGPPVGSLNKEKPFADALRIVLKTRPQSATKPSRWCNASATIWSEVSVIVADVSLATGFAAGPTSDFLFWEQHRRL